MTTALFYLAKPTFGGWVTFTSHLAHGLEDAHIFRVSKRTENTLRDFGRGLKYQNVDLDYALALSSTFPSIITAADKNFTEAASVLGKRSLTVTHDPTELKNAHASNPHQVVIRQSMLEHLPNATYIPHPYLRAPDLLTGQRKGAVAISRIDFDKRTHMIVEACEMGAPIKIYGTENAIYTHHKLSKDYPRWKDHYYGAFPKGDLWAGARLAAKHEAMVDLSVISGDGGGTQYTFLEALDAGAHLILHADWNPDEHLSPHATTVSDAHQLKELLTGDLPTPDPTPLLQRHDAHTIAETYRQLAQTTQTL